MEDEQFDERLIEAFEKTLEEARVGFESGNRLGMIAGVAFCLRYGIELPDWLREAFVGAYDQVIHGEASGWDEVFGRPHKKGAHLASIKKRSAKEPAVWLDVHAAVTEGGRALDESLFEDVGRKHGLGKTLAADYYYAFKKRAEMAVAESKEGHPETRVVPDAEIIRGLAMHLAGVD